MDGKEREGKDRGKEGILNFPFAKCGRQCLRLIIKVLKSPTMFTFSNNLLV